MRNIIRFTSLFIIFSFSALGSDFHSPRTMALGGAGHAGPLLNDSIYLNPSFASFLPTYSVGLNWLWYEGPRNANGTYEHGRNYNVSIQDGRSKLFQAGAGLTVREDTTMIHIGGSKRLGRWGVGIGGKLLFNPDGGNAQDLTLSGTFVFEENIQGVFIVDNLIESNALRERGMYRELILGSKFNVMGIVMIYFDPHLAPSLPASESFGHELGVEFTVMKDLFLRVGQFRNSMVPFIGRRSRGFGLGLGYLAPRISLDYGLSRVLYPIPNTAHEVGATVYF